jgi:hypothetical protein
MNVDYELCRSIMERHAFPLLFATVSGAHLYGFPSPDSDYDLRGAHVLSAQELLSLQEPKETVESSGVVHGVEIDLVTHDVAKFMRMLLKTNGYVLEQLLSPLVVQTSDEHQELVGLAARCVTRHHAHHYLGFAETQWNLFAKEQPPRVKPLLYVYRVLLTGIHLMRSGVVEANLPRLNAEYRLPYIDDLIASKVQRDEQTRLSDADMTFHRGEYERLRARLELEHKASKLPEAPSAQHDLSELLVRIRFQHLRMRGTA